MILYMSDEFNVPKTMVPDVMIDAEPYEVSEYGRAPTEADLRLLAGE